MGPKHRVVESKYSVISGINPFFYTRRIVTIKHPVCKKHSFSGRFYSFLSHQSFVDLFVGMLLISVLLFLPIMFLPFAFIQKHSLEIFCMLCFAYVIAVTVMKAKAPIKVTRPKDQKVKIRFANDAYATAFKMINQK